MVVAFRWSLPLSLTLLACSTSGTPVAGSGGAPASEGGSSYGGAASGGAVGGKSGEQAGAGVADGHAGGPNGAGGSSAGGPGSAGGGGDASGRGGASSAGSGTGGAPSSHAGSGGSLASAGAPASSGGASGASAGQSDRCDVGVYDAAHPPQVLSLSGNLGTHDPSAIDAGGVVYSYATGLAAKTSSNLTAWQAAARPFATPTWAATQVPGVTDLWAPDISYFNGLYHLYYAASTFGSNRSCIGQATRSALDSGAWADQGQVICSNIGTKQDWNAIDPNVIVDEAAAPWLVFGSFWGGIQIIALDSAGARAGTTVTTIAARPSNGGALEGAFMVRRCGYFYLFTSWDTCCKGADSTYNIRVGRSTAVTGPFVDKAGKALISGGGTLMAQSDSTWAGPGGQSVLLRGKQAYLVYHAYAKSNGAATLRIAELVWDSSGWPIPVGP